MLYPTPSDENFGQPEVELTSARVTFLLDILDKNRRIWKGARHHPKEDLPEDELHDTIFTLNNLAERATELQRSEASGGTLRIHTPRELDEIISSTLTVLHLIDKDEIDTAPVGKMETLAEIQRFLRQFTDVHHGDDPLAAYWYGFGRFTPDSPGEPIIEAIAKHGERTHVLREMTARRNSDYSLSAYENPERLDADPDDPDDVAQKFIEEWDNTRESMAPSQYRSWLQDAEAEMGLHADALL